MAYTKNAPDADPTVSHGPVSFQMTKDGPLVNPGVFNVRYNSTFSLDRVYRIYSTDSDLYFVRIGGQFWGVQEGVVAGSHGAGFIGALIVGFVTTSLSVLWETQAGRKQAALLQTIDQIHPERLLDRHKHNFKLTPADFQHSLIEPPSFAFHGPHAGRWKSVLRNGRKLNLEFLENEDVHVALSLLPHIIGSALTVNVQWNWRKRRFTKGS